MRVSALPAPSHPPGGALWLLRHAQPLVAPGVCYGRLDVPADPLATLASAKALLAHWRAQGHARPVAVWSSPLQRARRLAQALTHVGLDAPICTVPELAEMDFGAWEGRRWDQIDPTQLAAWTADFWSYPPGGGEPVRTFMARVGDAWQQACAVQGPLLWVTHAGVIRALDVALSRESEAADPFAQPLEAQHWPKKAIDFGGWVLRARPGGQALKTGGR